MKVVYLVYLDLGYDGILILGIGSTVQSALEIAYKTGDLDNSYLCIDEYTLDKPQTYDEVGKVFRCPRK